MKGDVKYQERMSWALFLVLTAPGILSVLVLVGARGPLLWVGFVLGVAGLIAKVRMLL